MATKKLHCNDCGCKFEIHEDEKEAREAGSNKAVKVAPAPAVSCPLCRSFEVTTA